MTTEQTASVNPAVRESMDQFLSMWRVLVGDRKNADLRDTEGIAYRHADNPFPYWDMLFLTEPAMEPQLLPRRLDEATAYMRTKTGISFVGVCEEFLAPETLAGLNDAVAKAGLTFAMTGRGMASEAFPLPEPAHASLEFVRVQTDEQLQALGELNCRAWDWPIEAGLAGVGGSTLWTEGAWSYLGLENGKPVSAASILVNQDCLFLALVATAPEAQRKGYGEAVVRKAMYEAAQATGLKRAILHATDMGFPVYEKIGYRLQATFQFYCLAQPL